MNCNWVYLGLSLFFFNYLAVVSNSMDLYYIIGVVCFLEINYVSNVSIPRINIAVTRSAKHITIAKPGAFALNRSTLMTYQLFLRTFTSSVENGQNSNVVWNQQSFCIWTKLHAWNWYFWTFGDFYCFVNAVRYFLWHKCVFLSNNEDKIVLMKTWLTINRLSYIRTMAPLPDTANKYGLRFMLQSIDRMGNELFRFLRDKLSYGNWIIGFPSPNFHQHFVCIVTNVSLTNTRISATRKYYIWLTEYNVLYRVLVSTQ